MPQAIRSEVYRSQVLDRTFQILDILADDGLGQGVTELAEKLSLHKSTTHPAHCSSLGKAILAFSSEEAVDEFFKGRSMEAYTPKTITSAEGLLKEIEAIRQSGYAIDDEEREEGLRCIGAPVWNSAGEV